MTTSGTKRGEATFVVFLMKADGIGGRSGVAETGTLETHDGWFMSLLGL
jgi:hypothetical protein